MSVIFRGNGTTTSSTSLGSYDGATVKDTIPDTRIYSDVPNATRVMGDSGIDYVYRRGKPRASFSLNWTMMPKDDMLFVQRIWAIVEMTNWFTVQTTDLTDGTTANPLKNELFNTTTATGVFVQGSYDGVNPMPGFSTNWILLGKYVNWTVGANAGIKSRIVDFFSTGQIQIETPITMTSGNKFYIGYPARFVSPLTVNQYGNIRTHYNVSVDCEVVIF